MSNEHAQADQRYGTRGALCLHGIVQPGVRHDGRKELGEWAFIEVPEYLTCTYNRGDYCVVDAICNTDRPLP